MCNPALCGLKGILGVIHKRRTLQKVPVVQQDKMSLFKPFFMNDLSQLGESEGLVPRPPISVDIIRW
ncbi:hypothetical protein [Paenibacillus lactis]|uniref:hypothetical protein n=1 Tax=Paenibacillus lactis TaxID=228574 RepID=UPI001643B37D